MINTLIEHGANVNFKLETHDSIKTPLSIVCEKGKKSIVKFLIEHYIYDINVNKDENSKKDDHNDDYNNDRPFYYFY